MPLVQCPPPLPLSQLHHQRHHQRHHRRPNCIAAMEPPSCPVEDDQVREASLFVVAQEALKVEVVEVVAVAVMERAVVVVVGNE